MAELDNKQAISLLNKKILKEEQEIGRTMNATTAEGKKQNKIARDNLKTLKATRKELVAYVDGYADLTDELKDQADLARQLAKTFKSMMPWSDALTENSDLTVKYGSYRYF